MEDLLLFAFIAFVVGLLLGYLWGTLRPTPAVNNIPRALMERVQSEADLSRAELNEREVSIRQLHGQLAAAQQTEQHLNRLLLHQKTEVAELQTRFAQQFEQIASKLLEEKSQRFTTQNQQNIEGILLPLRERLRDFELHLQNQSREATKERSSLHEELRQIKDLNQQLSRDANSLVSALRSDNKRQGNWGELQLERLLERAGLEPRTHYLAQPTLTAENGNSQRPDIVIYLPGQKHLLIDSKMSLLAYQQYHENDNEEIKKTALQAHIQSLRQHIKDLSAKQYQQLREINAPDYILLFVPIEPALSLALQHDDALFGEALDRNVVLVSSSTLLATMRTVTYLWRQEKQRNNAIEIARQSGLLYDKFVAFTEDLRTVGQRIDQTNLAYRDAMNKLSDSARRGDSLLGRAERLRELGAKTSKKLHPELLPLDETEPDLSEI